MKLWLDQLRDDLNAEFAGKPPTAVLATVRWNGDEHSAAARTVVVRDISSDGAMLIASDARSEKNGEVRQSPRATLVFWCASVKRQYRVCGVVDISANARRSVWEKLSDRARALFVWPAPGTPKADVTVTETVSATAAIPDCFEVLRVAADVVQTLDLNQIPHARVRWTFVDGEWSAEPINP